MKQQKIERFRGQYRFLSNFYPCYVRVGKYTYPSAEHAFQAMKTLDEKERKRIRHAPTPQEAKRLGRRVKLREDWEQRKVRTMTGVVYRKFLSDVNLKRALLLTGDAELIEGNTWMDTFWGVDLRTGKGQNYLGRILMAVRRKLRAEQ